MEHNHSSRSQSASESLLHTQGALSAVHQMLDTMTVQEMLMFMDAYSCYNQIRVHIPNQEHTFFIIVQGLYYNRVMPFNRKNGSATYQRMIKKMSAKQIDSNMKVYVDDMLLKSRKAVHHEMDLCKTFDALRNYNMKLNPN